MREEPNSLPRFSKFKTFYYELYCHFFTSFFDELIANTRKFVNANEGTLDGILGKTILCNWLLVEGNFKELELLLLSLTPTGENFVDFFIYRIFYFYFLGANDPSIDLKRGDEYFQLILETASKIIFEDEWEKYLINSNVLFLRLRGVKDPNELTNLGKQIITLSNEYSGQGTFEFFYLNDIGEHYIRVGLLDLAIETFQNIINVSSNYDVSFMPIANLSNVYFLKGQITLAKSTLDIAFKLFDKSTNYFFKSLPLLTEASILEHEQKYDELEKNLTKHLDLVIKTKNGLKIFERNLDLFNFYFNRFKTTTNSDYLEKANLIKNRLDKIAVENTDAITIQRLNLYAEALLLKIGTTRQRAKAMEIYESLIKTYPSDPKFKLELIELYWGDLAYDRDGSVKEMIDGLLSEIQQSPLIEMNKLTYFNAFYKILLARYDFFINGNTREALENLYTNQSNAISNGYILIVEQLNKEINLLESNIEWEKMGPSLKERLEKFKFKSYMERAKILLKE